MANKVIHVAAAAIWRNSSELLIAKRPDDKHQGGLWEFPGGKVEPDEDVLSALSRELEEELGIEVTHAEKLIQVPYHYPDKSVLLDVYSVTAFSGEPWGKEGQPVRWVSVDDLASYAFPAANKPILDACLLPKSIAITPFTPALSEAEQFVDKAVKQGAEGIVLRSSVLEELASDTQAFIESKNAAMTASNGFFAVNTSVERANELGLKAVHLNGANLAEMSHRDEFKGRWLGASCHDAEQIGLALGKGVDYIMLSPVQRTQSHPEIAPLGWDKFAELVELSTVPVFALGGVGLNDLPAAVAAGAQGIAAINAWSEE